MERIIFLGTGGDAEVVGSALRMAGGIYVESGQDRILIDPGPGCLAMLKQCNINVRNLTAILASHDHVNHAAELAAVIGAMTVNGRDRHGTLLAPPKTLKLLSQFHISCVEHIIEAKTGSTTTVGGTRVTCLLAVHDTETVGFKLATSKCLMAYSSDTKYSPSLASQYKPCDILVLNCNSPGKSRTSLLSGHDAERIIRAVKPRMAALTHFGWRMITAPLEESRRIKAVTGINVLAAEDGMTLDPESYNAAPQPSLAAFTDLQDTLQGSQE